MIEAYRLLTHRMYALGWDYPLHLGVTEAGLDIEGRMKSAVGIGALACGWAGGYDTGFFGRGSRSRGRAL